MKAILILFFYFVHLYASNYQALLLSGNCLTCHHHYSSISAPSLKKIQQTYKNAFPIKKDFVEYMSTWAEHPNKDTSLMQLDIQKYEIMPELGFDKVFVKEIADYIYELEFKETITE